MVYVTAEQAAKKSSAVMRVTLRTFTAVQAE